MYCVKCGKKIKNEKDGCSNCNKNTTNKRNNNIYDNILIVISIILVMGTSAMFAIKLLVQAIYNSLFKWNNEQLLYRCLP
ncbi:MAG: hypothetical protein ACRC2K_08375 [Clostridium sp.]